jgi:hypothetical protein
MVDRNRLRTIDVVLCAVLAAIGAIATAVAASTGPGHAPGQTTCIDYADYMQLAGSYVHGGRLVSIDIGGQYAFAANTHAGVQVFDISDPRAPQFITEVATPYRSQAVRTSGHLVLVAEGSSSTQGALTIIHGGQTGAVEIMSRIELGNGASSIASHGTLVCAGTFDGTVYTFDITDPWQPEILGSVAMPVQPRCLVMTRTHAFVASGYQGLHVIDITDPTAPVQVAHLEIGSSARGLALAGTRLYIANQSNGMQVIDVSVPHAPTTMSVQALPTDAFAVTVHGAVAFVGGGVSGPVWAIDVADPYQPTIIGSIKARGTPLGIACTGTYAFVASDWEGLQIIDIANPRSPQPIGGIDTPGDAQAVAIAGNHALLIEIPHGLRVIDIADPNEPTLVASLQTRGRAHDVAISGGFAFIPDWTWGLLVIDIADPATPQIAGLLSLSGQVSGVAIHADLAFVADVANGVRVVDISVPQVPVLKSTVYAAGSAIAVAMVRPTTCVAVAHQLTTIDAAEPAHPQLLGSVPLPGIGRAVAVAGDHAFVACSEMGMVVVDIADLAAPAIVAVAATPGWAYGVTVLGDHAYVGGGLNGLLVFNVADPTAPRLVGCAHTRGSARRLAGDGSRVFIANWKAGLRILPTQCEATTAVAQHRPRDPGLRLLAGPNPTADQTSISFEVQEPGPLRVSVYDLAGRRVRDLVSEVQPAGRQSLLWDGCDDRGRTVAAGVYLVRVESLAGATTARIVRLR